MLSTVIAAESQFRVDTAERDRARSLLAAMSSRRSALAAAKEQVVHPARRRAAAWPRPIAAPPVCAPC